MVRLGSLGVMGFVAAVGVCVRSKVGCRQGNMGVPISLSR